MNYTKLFPPGADYICYALLVTQHLKLNSQINKALKKKKKSVEREIKLTQQKLFNTFFETAKPFLLKDKALQFMDNVKGTPAY